jgi:hypothetical protein
MGMVWVGTPLRASARLVPAREPNKKAPIPALRDESNSRGTTPLSRLLRPQTETRL